MKAKIVLVLSGLLLFAVSAFAEGTLADDLKAIMDKQWTLEQKIDKIMTSPGVKVNGQLKFSSTDVFYSGGGAAAITGTLGDADGNTQARYRPMTQLLDLDFNARLTKEISIDGMFRFEYVLGGAWGFYNLYGVRRLYAKGLTDYADFYIGDYQAKLTSLTVMPCEDTYLNDFESDIYAYKKDSNKADLFLSDNSWPLSGLTMSKKFNIVDKTFGFGYKIMGAYLARGGDMIYDVSPAMGISPGIPLAYTPQHNQFLYSISPTFSLFDMVDLTGHYVDIMDAKDSGIVTAPAINDQVMGADVKVNIANIVNLYGEFQMSNYNTGADADLSTAEYDYVTGTAMKLEAEVKAEYLTEWLPKISVKGGYLSVDNDYIAFGAQTKIYDPIMNGQQVLTQNNTWSVQAKGADGTFRPDGYIFLNSLVIPGKIYPLTRYRNVILASNGFLVNNMTPAGFITDPGAFLIGKDGIVFPYGDATPNRAGPYANLAIDIAGGSKIEGFFAMPSTIKTANEADPAYDFMLVGGGVKVKLMDMIELKGGAKMETMVKDAVVNATFMTMDGGVKVTLFNALDLMAGLQMKTWQDAQPDPITFQGNMMSYGGGVRYNIQKGAYMNLLYTTSTLTDEIITTGANDFQADEIDVNLVLSF